MYIILIIGSVSKDNVFCIGGLNNVMDFKIYFVGKFICWEDG